MSQEPIRFGLLDEIRQGNRRMIGVLKGDKGLNVAEAISGLSLNERRNLLARIQHWVDGGNGPKKWFHGFPNEKAYSMCFVFKLGDRRFYGYLCHPLQKEKPAMQACVLCSSAMKHKWETDPGEKKLTKHWSESDEARKVAVREISANTPNDDQKGKKQWRM